jgi:TonB-dependent starch-binding outer membrane protein SusC
MNVRVTDTQIDGSGTSGDTYKVRTTDAVKYPATQGLNAFKVVNLDEMSDEEREEYLNASMTLADQAKQYWKQRVQRGYNLTAGVEWKILKNLIYRVDAGYNYGFNETKSYWGETTTNASYVDGKPLVEWNKQNTARMRIAQTLSFDHKIEKHSFNTMIGQELLNNTSNMNNMYATSFSPELTPEKIFANMALSSSSYNKLTSRINPDDRLLSYFGRIGYNYSDRYLVNFTMRGDGSSKFRKGNRWGYFPAAAVAWRMSEEEFMYNFKNVLSNLKFRLSYGTSGNNDIASTLYQLDYAISSTKPYGLGDEPSNYYAPTNADMANPNLEMGKNNYPKSRA